MKFFSLKHVSVIICGAVTGLIIGGRLSKPPSSPHELAESLNLRQGQINGAPLDKSQIKPIFKNRAKDVRSRTLLQKLESIYDGGVVSQDVANKINNLLLELSAISSVDALEWIRIRGVPYQTELIIQTIIAQADVSSVSDLLELLGKSDSSVFRYSFLSAFVARFADTHPLLCAELMLEEKDANIGDTEKALFSLASVDASAALKLISQYKDKALMSQVLRQCAERLVKTDSQRALLFATGLQPDTLKEEALRGVVKGLAQTAPAKAGDFVLQLPAGPLRSQAILDLLMVWGNASPTEVVDWIQNSLIGAERNKSISQMLMLMGENTDPVLYTLLDELPSASLKSEALRYAAPKLPANLSPSDAFATVESWGSPVVAGVSLRRYVEDLATQGLPVVAAIIHDPRFPEKERIRAWASILAIHSLDSRSLIDNIKKYAGDAGSDVARVILSDYQSNLTHEAAQLLTQLIKDRSK